MGESIRYKVNPAFLYQIRNGVVFLKTVAYFFEHQIWTVLF